MKEEVYEYDKYMVLRPKSEANVTNQSIGKCSDCGDYIWKDGNSRAVDYKTVTHRVCPHPPIKGQSLIPPFCIEDLIADRFMKLYTHATILARKTSQTTGAKNDYYITLEQLNELMNEKD